MSGEDNVSVLGVVKIVVQGRQIGGDEESEKTQDILITPDRAISVWNQLIGYDGTRQRIVKLDDDGELITVNYGKDAAGNIDAFRTNASEQQQIELVGPGKILGTYDPAITTNTNLYTVPASTTTHITELWCVNRGSSVIKVRIGIDVGGSGTNAPDDSEWLYYNLPLDPGQTLTHHHELWLATTDDLVVYSDISDASFGASGIEHV